MLTNKTTVTDFYVDNYVDINEFRNIKLEAGNDPYYFAAVIGCLEGIFQISKENLIFLNMYKIKLNSEYKFIGLYIFLKNNKKYYEYIVNYFNVWHSGNNDIFIYDEYSKKDLTNNYYELVSQLIKEKEMAKSCKDEKVFEAYNFFCNNLSSVLS